MAAIKKILDIDLIVTHAVHLCGFHAKIFGGGNVNWRRICKFFEEIGWAPCIHQFWAKFSIS